MVVVVVRAEGTMTAPTRHGKGALPVVKGRQVGSRGGGKGVRAARDR